MLVGFKKKKRPPQSLDVGFKNIEATTKEEKAKEKEEEEKENRRCCSFYTRKKL